MSTSAKCRVLFDVHRSGDIGSPRVAGSMSRSRATRIAGFTFQQRPTTRAGPSDAAPRQGRSTQFLQALVDRRPRQSRTTRDGRHAPASELRRIRCRHEAPLSLVQMVEQRSVLGLRAVSLLLRAA